MDHTPIHRVKQRFFALTSRREIVAALGLLFLGRARPVGAQLSVPGCRPEGEVCTHLVGCCNGLICATSAININYGVCIPGEGEHAIVTTEIVAPFGDGVVTELAAELVEAEAAEAEAVALITERETALDTRRTTRRTNKDTRRATRRTTRDTRQTTKETRRTTRRLNEVPEITIELVPAHSGHPETVRVRNFDSVAVVLTRIEAMFHPHNFSTLSVTIPVGGTHVLHSGRGASSAWTQHAVCPDAGGVIVTAQHSGGTQPHLFSVPCGATVSWVHVETGHRHKRKRAQERRRRRERRHRREKRRERKHRPRR